VDRPPDAVAVQIALRPVDASDLDAIFEQMRDPESVHMAAFTAEDPDDRSAFDAHMAKIMSSPENGLWAIDRDGRLVGTIGSYPFEGATEVTYWIDRSCWGQGIATQALRLLLDQIPARPVRARAASDNAGSLRVLEKAGFRPIGTEMGFGAGRPDRGDDPRAAVSLCRSRPALLAQPASCASRAIASIVRPRVPRAEAVATAKADAP
jgi:RimJ/RimL family protein N-acetyltransferase